MQKNPIYNFVVIAEFVVRAKAQSRRAPFICARGRNGGHAIALPTLRIPCERTRISAMRKLPVVHIFSCVVGQITTMLLRIPHLHEGRFAIVTDVGSGMRWT
jgi:hypothetical protein